MKMLYGFTLALALLLAGFAVTLTSYVGATPHVPDPNNFVARLTGAGEVPPPGDPGPRPGQAPA
jgi:hypothetical protein